MVVDTGIADVLIFAPASSGAVVVVRYAPKGNTETMRALADLCVLPQPRLVQPAGGVCLVPLRSLRVGVSDAAHPPLGAWAAALGLRLRPQAGLPAYVAMIGTTTVPDAPKRPQGYALRIAPDGLAVRGHDVQGLTWGLVTLSQLMGQATPLPCGLVDDWPEYGIRYHHDDISRKQVSTVEDFRRILRHLASFKVSHYTPYIEDMLRVDAIPFMGEGRGALSADDVRHVAGGDPLTARDHALAGPAETLWQADLLLPIVPTTQHEV